MRSTRTGVLGVVLAAAAIGAALLAAQAPGMTPMSHPAPAGMAVSIEVEKDAIKGRNLQVLTKAFRWAPWNASGKHVAGQGHAHPYVDGTKITRLYGPWFYLGDLKAGKHTIKVTLNGNDHGDYTRGGKAISTSRTVTVS